MRDQEGHKPFPRGLNQELDELGEMGCMESGLQAASRQQRRGSFGAEATSAGWTSPQLNCCRLGSSSYELFGLESVSTDDQGVFALGLRVTSSRRFNLF
jgi:hypothetical protein